MGVVQKFSEAVRARVEEIRSGLRDINGHFQPAAGQQIDIADEMLKASLHMLREGISYRDVDNISLSRIMNISAFDYPDNESPTMTANRRQAEEARAYARAELVYIANGLRGEDDTQARLARKAARQAAQPAAA